MSRFFVVLRRIFALIIIGAFVASPGPWMKDASAAEPKKKAGGVMPGTPLKEPGFKGTINADKKDFTTTKKTNKELRGKPLKTAGFKGTINAGKKKGAHAGAGAEKETIAGPKFKGTINAGKKENTKK